MAALFLAPLYILVNIYVVRWMFLWMGACHHIFQTFFFRALFVGIYIFFSTSLLTGFLIKKPEPLHRFLKNTGNYFLGTFMYIILVIVIADLSRLVLKYIFHVTFIRSRTSFVVSGAVCCLLIIFVSIYGILHMWNLKVTPYQVTVHKQVEGMDSLKIVLVADTHFGYSYGSHHAKQLVEKINAQDPDLVCFAGDIFDNEYDALQFPDQVKESLKSIRSKYGVYACWGNHDLNEPILAGFTFGGAQPDYEDPRMEEFLKDAGIHLLNDESVLIDNRFYLVGRRDASRSEKMEGGRKTPAQLTENLDRSKPVIFIDHQPKELSEIADAGADLDLCGHTHDGQLFPGNLFVQLFWENSCGYLKKGDMHNIVTSGAGIWGPNMRVGTDCEICVITAEFR
ncbi:metallophosphoesterase [Ruminococcus sp. 5_1_39BFAA]|uniref:metallophosphoesterase n=1 Tax=Ruminococcus sp. 5_1_39BFAA TaxID=457412 RepID=UPI003563C51D